MAATLRVSGGITCSAPGGVGYNQVSVGPVTTPLTAAVERSDRGCSGASAAEAGAGYIGGVARGTISERLPLISSSSSFSASAEFKFRIQTPDDYDGGDIAFGVNGHLHALMEGSLPFDPIASGVTTSITTLSYSLFVAGSSTTDGPLPRRLLSDVISLRLDNILSDPTYPGAATQDVDVATVTAPLMVDPTRDVTVRFSLSGSGGVSSAINTFAVNALNTFGFDPDGPAFSMPDGFLISSADASIVNNRWIDPRLPTPSAVPLPASSLLILTGLAALIGLRRQKPLT